jgi:hypothetical protein
MEGKRAPFAESLMQDTELELDSTRRCVGEKELKK